MVYDPEADALSLRLRAGRIARIEEMEGGLEALYDDHDTLLGVSFRNARKRLTPEELTSVTYENLATKQRSSLRLP